MHVRHKIFQTMVLISFLIIMTATIPLCYAYEWSPDMGLTWNNNIDGNPSIAQANDGKIWVVWNSYRTGNAEIFYKVYDSFKVHPWSSEKNLTANPSVDKTPSIMQAKDGKIWVVWSTNRDGNYKIYYKTSSNNGATWSPDQNLTAIQNPKDDEHPSIMQTVNGTIWLAWSANRTGNYEIYYKTSQDNGTTWSTDMSLNYTDTDDRNPSITQSADGKIYFVWVRNKDQDKDGDPDLNIWYRTYYYSYLSNKWVWSGSTTQVTQDLDVFNLNPSITQAKDGKIWVVWDSDKLSAQADLYYRILLSAELPTRLTINQGEDFAPSIMQAADETIWIVWAAYRADNFDIYYKTTKILPPHDVAIFSVIPTEVTVNEGQTVSVSIEVVAQNHGTNEETGVTVRLYADSTLMNESTIGLSSGQLYPMAFTWKLNAGTYEIWAKASVVNEEIYILDNTFPAILGDVNGDQTVNATDLSALSNAYGSKPGDPNWNPNCNFYGDDKVDAYDLFDLGKNYGKSQYNGGKT